MPIEIVAIVLVAALAHASWNALVKSDDDRLVTLGAVNAVRFLLCIPIVLALPLPASASWPYLAASAILHVGYYILLISAYRFGDLSRVYPLARGLSPLIVAAGGFVFAGEQLSSVALVGIVVACAGIVSLSFDAAAVRTRSGRGAATGGVAQALADGRGGVFPRALTWVRGHERSTRTTPEDRRGVLFAAGTALFIAAYTVTDAIGVRLSGHAVSYVAWLAILDGLPMLLAAAGLRRAALGRHLADRAWRSVAGGVLQLIAYGLVVWALALAPMAAVSALRETSVLFAAIIGVKLLGEPLGARRIGAAVVVTTGIVMIELG